MGFFTDTADLLIIFFLMSSFSLSYFLSVSSKNTFMSINVLEYFSEVFFNRKFAAFVGSYITISLEKSSLWNRPWDICFSKVYGAE